MLMFDLYVSSYHRLSRRGMQEAEQYGMPGILYMPLEEVARKQDASRHYLLATLYYPLNEIDQALFDGKGPVRSIMFGLSR
jgi:hypothetical protein